MISLILNCDMLGMPVSMMQ